jgi:hypothetical protein
MDSNFSQLSALWDILQIYILSGSANKIHLASVEIKQELDRK